MSNTAQSAKKQRQDLKKNQQRSALKTAIKNILKKVKLAIDSASSKNEVINKINEYQSKGARCARKNVISKKSFNRKMSALQKAFNEKFKGEA